MQGPQFYILVCPSCGQGKRVNAAAPVPVHGDDPCPLVVTMHKAQIQALEAQTKVAQQTGILG